MVEGEQTPPYTGEPDGSTNANDHANTGGGGSDQPGVRRTRRDRQSTNEKKFKGTVPEMKGHVFQTYNEAENKNQFNKTCERLG